MSELINDDELKIFLEKDYDSKFEENLIQTDIGKRIIALQKLGVNVSLKQFTKKYIEKNGREFDSAGKVVINTKFANEVYVETLNIISKQLGYEIADSYLNKVENVDLDTEIVELQKMSGIEEYKSIKEIFKSAKEDSFGENILSNDDISEILKLLSEGTVTAEDIAIAIEQQEKASSDNNIENNADIDLLCFVYDIRILENTKYNSSEMTDEDKANLIQGWVKDIKKVAPNSKFYERLRDKKGEITRESINEFITEFEYERNEEDLYNKATQYLTYDASEIDDEKRIKILKMFLRAERSKNNFTRTLAKGVAEKLGFDVITNGVLNKNKIEELCAKEIPGKTPDEIVEDAELNYKTAPREIIQIGNTIERCGDCVGRSREEILKYRESSKNVQERICSEKERDIFAVLNSVNAGNVNKNGYEDEKYVKIVVALYCKFREEEIAKNNKNFKGLSYQSFNREKEGSSSSIVRKFMQENSKYFGKYLKDFEKVDSKTALKMLEEEKMSKTEFNEYLIAYRQIKTRTDRIEKKELKNEEKLTYIKNSLKEFYFKRDNERIIDKELQEKIFSECKGIPIEVFSTETLNKLQGLNPQKFEKTFKETNRKIGQNTTRSMYFAAARLFTYVPMLINSATEKGKKGYALITSKIHNNNEQKEKKNGVKDFFNKIFGNKKLLEEGKNATAIEQKEQENVDENKDYIAREYGIKVNEKKAINQTVNQDNVAKYNDKEEQEIN